VLPPLTAGTPLVSQSGHPFVPNDHKFILVAGKTVIARWGSRINVPHARWTTLMVCTFVDALYCRCLFAVLPLVRKATWSCVWSQETSAWWPRPGMQFYTVGVTPLFKRLPIDALMTCTLWHCSCMTCHALCPFPLCSLQPLLGQILTRLWRGVLQQPQLCQGAPSLCQPRSCHPQLMGLAGAHGMHSTRLSPPVAFR
jgi:hypothetical protein